MAGCRSVVVALALPALASCAAPAVRSAAGVDARSSAGTPAQGEPVAEAAFVLPGRCVADSPSPHCGVTFYPDGYDWSEPDQVEADSILVTHARRFLAAFAEPSLAGAPPGVETYRFLWLRSFHAPYVVRVERSSGRALLVLRRAEGAGGYDPGPVVEERIRPLSEDEWESVEALAREHLWSLPDEQVRPPRPPPLPGGIQLEEIHIDGADWILEGARDGRHRVVRLWSPEAGGLRELCLRLLSLGGVDLSATAVY